MILSSQETIQKYTDMGVYSDKTLLDYFNDNVEKNPDRIAIVDPPNKMDLMGYAPERLTYGKLQKKINALADALVGMGIQKDDIIMVQMPNCWELAILYLSIAKAGAIISPAPVLWRESELDYIASTTDAKLFITVENFKGFKHAEMGFRLKEKHLSIKDVLTIDKIRELSEGELTGESDSINIDANDISTICWTSGTEANSKGCPLSHNNWMGVMAVYSAAGIQHGDVLITAGPLVNMASLASVYIPWLYYNGTLVLHHPFDPAIFIQQIIAEKPNYTLLVPAVANMIAKHPMVDSFDLSSFRVILLGSAPLSLWTMNEFKKRWDVNIGNIWGQNEGTGLISGIEEIPDMEERATSFPHYGKPGSKWKSLASGVIEVKIIDVEGTELTTPGEMGELVCKGPSVISGYFKNPEMTKMSFTEDGFLKTGDLFRIEEGNRISFYERSKDIIIRGGFNISSQEIENYIISHPKVQDAAVVGMPDEKLGERMCVYVVPQNYEPLTLKDITDVLKEKGIAKYKYPERLEIINAIPRNPVGKILKKSLREDVKIKMTKN